MNIDIEELNQERQKKNARFRKANKAKKRIMIARDVLSQIGGRFIPTSGVWVQHPTKGSYFNADRDSEFCDLTSKMETCHVCGIGAIFVSAVEFSDRLKLKDFAFRSQTGDSTTIRARPSAGDIWKYLGKWFDKSQLDMIECAFERGYGEVPKGYAGDSHLFFSDIDEAYDATLRMRLIMENIVANKGTFDPNIKPEKKTVYVTPGYKG